MARRRPFQILETLLRFFPSSFLIYRLPITVAIEWVAVAEVLKIKL